MDSLRLGMSLEFILQLAYSTCHNCLSSGLIDRDPDSFLSTSWTYEDGWKLLLHDTYYTTSSTTQNTLTPHLSQASAPRFVIYLWFEVPGKQMSPVKEHCLPSNMNLYTEKDLIVDQLPISSDTGSL